MATDSIPIQAQVIANTGSAATTIDKFRRREESRPINVRFKLDDKAIISLNKPLGAIRGQADEFTKSMNAANARVLAFGASVGVIAAVQRAFTGLIKTTAQVEETLTKISVIAGDDLAKAGISLEKFGKQLFAIGRQTGQTFQTVGEAALEFSRQGLSFEETLARTTDALILTRISGLDAKSSVEGLTAAFNAFKSTGIEFSQILNKIVAVDNAFAVSAADLVEGIQRAGSISQQTGQDIDELIATITVLQEATARGGSVIGNSFKTIAERFQRAENINILQQLGIGTRDEEGKILSTVRLITNLAAKIDEIDQAGKTDLLRKLSGNFQINQLSAFLDVLKNVEGAQNQYVKAQEKSINASNEAKVANESLNKVLLAGINASILSVQELANKIGNLGVLEPLKKVFDSIQRSFQFLSESLDGEGIGAQLGRGLIKGLGGVLFSKTTFVAAGIIIGKLLVDLGAFSVKSIKTLFNLNQLSLTQKEIQQKIVQQLSQQFNGYSSINLSEKQRLELARQISAEYLRHDQLARSIQKNAALISPIATRTVLNTQRRAAGGYLPDLISAEANDVRSGVGGANKNAKVVVIPDFPFGKGKRGTMVANTSETIIPFGDSAAVLNQDMLKGFKNGKRAADGDIPTALALTLTNTAVARKSGLFPPIKKIEAELNALIPTLNDQNKSGLQFVNAIRSALKPFELTGQSIQNIVKESNAFAKELAKQKAAIKAAFEREIEENAKARRTRQETLLREAKNELAKDVPNPSKRGGVLGSGSTVVGGLFGREESPSSRLLRATIASQIQQQLGGITGVSRGTVRSTTSYAQPDLETLTELKRRSQKISSTSDPLSRAFLLSENAPPPRLIKITRDSIVAQVEEVLKRGTAQSRQIVQSLTRKDRSPFGQLTNITPSPVPSNIDAERFRVLQNMGLLGTQGGPIGQTISTSSIPRTRTLPSDPLSRGAALASQRAAALAANRPRGLSNIVAETKARETAQAQKDFIEGLKKSSEQQQKSFSEVTAKLFALSFVAEGLTAAFNDVSGPVGKFGRVLTETITAIVVAQSVSSLFPAGKAGGLGLKAGFKAGREGVSLKGVEDAGLLAGLGASLGRNKALGSTIDGLKDFTSLIKGLGGFLLRFIPIIGQVAAVGTIIQSVGKEFFGVDLIGEVFKSLGFLSDGAKKAKQSLDDFNRSLGDDFALTLEELSDNLIARGQDIRAEIKAEQAGIKGAGGRASAENLLAIRQKGIRDILGATLTGGTVESSSFPSTGVGLGGISVSSIRTPSRPQTVADLSAFDQITPFFEKFAGIALENVTEFASRSGIDVSQASGIEDLRQKATKAIFENLFNEQSFQNIGNELSVEQTRQLELLLASYGDLFKKPIGNLDKNKKDFDTTVFNLGDEINKRLGESFELTQQGKDAIENIQRTISSNAFQVLGEFEQAVVKARLDSKTLAEEFQIDFRKAVDDLFVGVLEAAGKEFSVDPRRQKRIQGKIVQAERSGALSDVNQIPFVFKSLEKLITGVGGADDVSVNQQKVQEFLRTFEQSLLGLVATNERAKKTQEGLTDQVDENLESFKKFNASMINFNRAISGVELSNIRLGGQADRVDVLKNFQLDVASSLSTSVEEEARRRAEIEQRALVERQGIEKEIAINQARIEAARELYTFENTQALKNATEAINNLTKSAGGEVADIVSFGNTSDILSKFQSFGGNVDDFTKQLFGAKLPEEDRQRVNSILEKYAFSIEEQNVKLEEANKTQQLVNDLNLKRADAEFRFQAALNGEIRAIDDRLKTQRLSAGERGSAERQRSRLQSFGGLSPEGVSRALSSGGQGRFEALDTIQVSIDDFDKQLNFDIVNGFRDGLVDAIGGAIDGTKTLKEALLDAALTFANKLRDAALNNLANIFTSKLFGGGGGSDGGGLIASGISALGGLFSRAPKQYATGGAVRGGSGVKDDVPTLLMGGEYVINKKAVNAYGKSFFDALNSGSVQGMASGGLFIPGTRGQGAITGKDDLLSFATQTATKGSTDVIRALGQGAAIASLEPESLKLSNFARFGNSPLIQSLQESKDQAFGLYLQQLGQEQDYEQQLSDLKKQEKDKVKSLLLSLGIAAVGGVFSGFKGFGGASSRTVSNASVANKSTAGQFFNSVKGAAEYEFIGNNYVPVRRNSGGYVSGGMGAGDSVKTLLSKDEFVINSGATKRLGDRNLYRMNRGEMPSSDGIDDERIVSRLDNLITKIEGQNEINITVNVTGDGNAQTQISDSGAGENSKRLAELIRQQVVQIVRDEKRNGGELRR